MSETLTQQPPSTLAEDTTSSPVERPRTDVLEQLLQPEVQASLSQLVESLPKLTEMVGTLTKAYDLGLAIATDRVLLEDLAGGMKEFVQPLQGKVKELAVAAMEANDRARMDQTTIGAFGLLRMLKDPQVQKALRYFQAFLHVLSEHEKA